MRNYTQDPGAVGARAVPARQAHGPSSPTGSPAHHACPAACCSRSSTPSRQAKEYKLKHGAPTNQQRPARSSRDGNGQHSSLGRRRQAPTACRLGPRAGILLAAEKHRLRARHGKGMGSTGALDAISVTCAGKRFGKDPSSRPLDGMCSQAHFLMHLPFTYLKPSLHLQSRRSAVPQRAAPQHPLFRLPPLRAPSSPGCSHTTTTPSVGSQHGSWPLTLCIC